MKNNKTRAVLTAIGCAVIMLLHGGHTSMWALHIPYMAETLGVDPSALSLGSSISTAVAFLMSLFVTQALIKKISAKYALMMASISTLVGAFLIYFANSLALVLISSIFSGVKLAIGTVMCASLILAEYRGVWNHALPKVTGIVSSASGLGGTVIMLICGRTIPIWGWRMNYLVVGSAIAIISILINVLLIRKPVSDEQVPTAQGVKNTGAARPLGEGVMLKEALRSPSLYLLMIGICLCNMLFSGNGVILPTFWSGLGMESVQISNFASTITFCGMLAIMISGFLIGKFGIKGFAIITFVGSMIGVALQSSYIEIRAAWVILLGAPFLALGGTVTTLSSQLVPFMFGTKDFAGINPFVNAAYFLGAGVSTYAVAKIAEVAGSFRVAHITSIICGAIGLACVLLAIKLAPYKASNAENSVEKAKK